MSSEKRDGFYKLCEQFIRTQYPAAIMDVYYPGMELLFYANERMEDKMIPYSCHKGRDGNLMIDTDF